MNAPQHTPDDDQLFDLLVDDELGEAERRELLARLDHVPDGWRRCALTFLEAQCWKKELGAMAREPAQVVRPAPPALDKKRPAFRWGTALAMAASFLVALGLGSVLRDAWHRGGPAPGQVATMVSEPQSPAPAGGPAADASRAPAWQMVTLAADRGQGGADESIRLPAVERDQIDENWLQSFPTAIPPEVVRALKNTGHEVRQSRRLMAVPMQDGRRLVVPMDEVDVHYVGGPAY